MKKIEETKEYNIYMDYFHGQPVRFLQDKKTGEILISADDAMMAMGANASIEEFLATDAGLDTINRMKQSEPEKPLFGENGFIRKINI